MKGVKWIKIIRVSLGVGVFSLFCLLQPAFADNHPPVMQSITISPQRPGVDNYWIEVLAVASDADRDSIKYKYEWYRKGNLQPTLTQTNSSGAYHLFTSTLGLTKGETWKCVVTPNDGKVNGQSMSVEITIAGKSPQFQGIISRAEYLNAIPGKTLSFKVQAKSIEGCPTINYEDPSLPAGASINQQTRIFSWGIPGDAQPQTYQLTFKAVETCALGADNTIQVNIRVLKKLAAANIDLSPQMQPVMDQGYLPTCASFAAAYYKTFQEGREHGWDLTKSEHQFSPYFLFALNDMEMEGIFTTLTKVGCLPLSSYGATSGLPSIRQFEEAMPFRSERFITSGVDNREHLAAGDVFSVAVSTIAYAQLAPAGSGGVYDGPPLGVDPNSAHAITIVGFDDNKEYTNQDGLKSYGAFRFINSWGTGWGIGGYGWISYDFLSSRSPLLTFYMEDKIGYQPKAIAYLTLTLGKSAFPLFELGVGPTDIPLWRISYYEFNRAFKYYPTRFSLAVDITDTEKLNALPPSSHNKWYLAFDGFGVRYPDPMGNVVSGTIESFSIKYPLSQGAVFYNSQDGFPIQYYRKIDTRPASPPVYAYISPNSPPIQPTVTIVPAEPKPRESLSAQVSGCTDPDGDVITYRYAWYKNVVLQSGMTSNTVPAGITAKDEVWKCVVVPNDGSKDGPAGVAEVRIANVNAVPVCLSVKVPGYRILALQDTTLQAVFSDPDGAADIAGVQVVLGDSETDYRCQLAYHPDDRELYLSQGSNWLGPVKMGTSAILDNGYVKLDCANSTASISGNTLTANFKLQLYNKPDFQGRKYLFALAADKANTYSGWQKKNWVDIQATPLISHTAITTALRGQPINFSAVVKDTSGKGLKRVSLFWRQQRAMEMTVQKETGMLEYAMKPVSADTYQVTLGAAETQRSKRNVYYYILAEDNAGQSAQTPTATINLLDDRPPTRPTVAIVPAQPKTTDDLVAQASGSTDADGDAITYRYAWYKNGVLQPGLTTNRLAAANTAKGQTWKCIVIPNDGKMDGASASAEVTIANSAPELAAIGNKSVFVGSNLQFSLSAQDADGDTLVYSAKSLPQGATFANNTFNWTPNQRGSYKVTFEVSDGTATDSEEITIEVTAPLAGPTNLTATYVSGAIHLRWQYSGPAGISIEIWRSLNSTAGFELVGTVNTGSYIYSDRTDLEERILYYYKVRAKKDSAYSVFSNVASARTP